MSTPFELAARFRQMAREMDRIPHLAVEGAALAVKSSVQRQLLIAGVRNNRLRGVGKKGARVAPRYDMIGADRALVRMIGPAQLIESDTKPHRIPRERKTKRGRKRYAVIPGVGVRAYVNHPGTKGKHPWAKGVATARPYVGRDGRHAVSAAMRRTFRG